MKILLTGDFCQNDRLYSLFDSSEYDSCFHGVKKFFDECDYSVVNLETPITNKSSEQIPYKINLRANHSILGALKYLGVNCCALANNHMMDSLEKGLSDTFSELTTAEVEYLGAGRNKEEKRTIKYISKDSVKVALLNYCEHEFSVTSSDVPGCNPLSSIDAYYDIQEAKKNAQFVVAIIHGGHEHYNLPSPEMKKLYHFLIDCGADAIINHHQHCFSGYEEYNGKKIFYGLGNFCFDWPGRRNLPWNNGYMVMLDFNSEMSFQLIPYCQMSESANIKLLSESEAASFKKEINDLNRIIADDKLLEKKFDDYCLRLRKGIKMNLSPYSSRYAMGFAARGILPMFDDSKRYFRLLNYIECESHREVVLNILHRNNYV